MLRARYAGVKVEGNPELVEGNCGVEGNREVEEIVRWKKS
jgi:hypothetical protein